MRYYGPTGKETKRDVLAVALGTGSSVQIEQGCKSLKITADAGKYHCCCKEHHASCEMTKPLSAIEWAETHLKQFH